MSFTSNEETKNIYKYKEDMELYTKTINLIKNIDDRATLQVLNTKLRISQNNPICGAQEKQPRLKKQHRLNLV